MPRALLDGETRGDQNPFQILPQIPTDPQLRAKERKRNVIQIGLDHTEGQQSAGAQEFAQPPEHGRDLVLRQQDQGEERRDGGEGAVARRAQRGRAPDPVRALGGQIVQVDPVELGRKRAGAPGLTGQCEHHVREVHRGHPQPAGDQLGEGRLAGAAAHVQHPGPRFERGEQPPPALQLPVLGGERLTVTGPDGVEGDRLQGPCRPASSHVGPVVAGVLADRERVGYLSGRHVERHPSTRGLRWAPPQPPGPLPVAVRHAPRIARTACTPTRCRRGTRVRTGI